MAVDSLLGGNTQSLDGPTRDVLTGILGDNIPGSNSVVSTACSSTSGFPC